MIQIHFVPIVFGALTLTAWFNAGFAQRPGINQDESKVPPFTLPHAMVCADGTPVDSVEIRESRRRPEIRQLFADHVYGNIPDRKAEVEFAAGDHRPWRALNGMAIRKEVRLELGASGNEIVATMLFTLPIADQPAPCFVGYNFNGNHTTTDDPRVTIPPGWVHNNEKTGAKNNRASQSGRGAASGRWPYEEIINGGYGVCTIHYGDIDPDFDDGFQNGIHPRFYAEGQFEPTQRQWGSIGAWAWGLSRAVDYFETDPSIDSKRVAVIGHSRLGKTALWAGASDCRFALVISNNSGCGGAALHRRKFGETVKVINQNFPHWFCDQFGEYNDNENELPVDQHMLIASIAPRPVYVASATRDLWADPKGEFLSLAHADSVYELYGNDPLPREMPAPNSPLMLGQLGYHLRSGQHDITLYDWQQYIEFANRHLKEE